MPSIVNKAVTLIFAVTIFRFIMLSLTLTQASSIRMYRNYHFSWEKK